MNQIKRNIVLFISVFGPATIAAMADNDAAGVATYSIAGAKLGYPILFALVLITILLAITQEMGMRLSLVTKKGLGDAIREFYGVKISVVVFMFLFIANLATITVNLSAIKTVGQLLSLPTTPMIILMIVAVFIFVTKGNYKSTQNVMLVSSFFYLSYIFSAFKSKPDWGLALSNMIFPHGVEFSPTYLKDYLVIGIGVLGTTITPWGQFFISSFSYDKKIDVAKLRFSQLETYIGAFLTDFFSFFMIVATAATLFVHNIPLVSGEQAALAIKPFAGELAGTLFAFGILNAGFMGVVIVSLTTSYAFSEFFGVAGSLDITFQKSPVFYMLFLIQLIIAGCIVMIPSVSLFKIAITAQTINATLLPLIFYFLIAITSKRDLMGQFVNTPFQRNTAIISSILIIIASTFAVLTTLFGL